MDKMNEEFPDKVYRFCPTCQYALEKKDIDDQIALSCPNCGFIFWNNPKPVASFLLVKDKRVLMLQRAHEPFKDYWCLPGGFMRYEETPEETAKREVREETRLGIKIDGLIGVYRIDNDPRGIHIDIIYHGKAHGEITLSKEDRKYNYFSPNELPELIAYKHREAVLDWLKKSL